AVSPMSCGAVHCDWCVTVTVAVATMQSFGAAGVAGLVVCAVTVSASKPAAGLNAPVNPAVVQAVRAAETLWPTMFGTVIFPEHAGGGGGGGGGCTGMPLIWPP